MFSHGVFSIEGNEYLRGIRTFPVREGLKMEFFPPIDPPQKEVEKNIFY